MSIFKDIKTSLELHTERKKTINMYIAYSAINKTRRPKSKSTLARQQGYEAACQKHAQTIADIRQYMPGWSPRFAVGGAQFAVESLQIAAYQL